MGNCSPASWPRTWLIWTDWQATWTAAFEASTLPERPTTLAALDDFVVRARLELAPYA